MNLTKAIIKRIKGYLKEKGMTQYALSLSSGVCQATISAILRGKVKAVQSNTLYDLCYGFGISIRTFFNDPMFDIENLID